ncbi:hypothetical protein SAMD00019534_046700, partial [Acytostelium subglobosum LB1]|uniref:hypothetical protein n=1 Tax=Acytostelium subglobosum LB1 TaxID=1410327 RepID=UPI0006447B45
MKVGVKVLSTGGGYTNPSVMLWSAHQDHKYLFNVGNGTHRQNLTAKDHAYNANHLFLTHIDPSTMADYPNYLLRNTDDFSLVGPVNSTMAVLSHRYYIGRRNKTIHVTECADDNIVLTDGYLTVYPLVLHPNGDIIVDNKDIGSQQSQTCPLIHPYKRGLTANSTYKAAKSMALSSFYEWTVLRGGMLDIGTGHPDFTTDDLEQYMIYRMMKISDDLDEVDIKSYRPANSKRIKEYIMDPFNFPHDGATTQQRDEFWSLESRHFRVVTRLTNLPAMTDDIKKRIVKERGQLFTSHKHYGPIKSQSKTFFDVKHDEQTGMGDVVCYICQMPDIIGKFDSKMADKLGVPNGPLRSKLCKGESVVIADGSTVRPEDVLSPSTIGPVFIVLACPDIKYLKALVSNAKLLAYGQGERSGCIAHMVPESIVNTPEYIGLINSFNPKQWQHLILNESCAYHELTIKSGQLFNGLSQLSPDFFPTLASAHGPQPLPQELSHCQRGRYQQKVVLNPLHKSKLPELDNTSCTEDTDLSFQFETQSPRDNNDGVVVVEEEKTDAEKRVERMVQEVTNEELEIVFLGTGCSQASEYRDESCIYLDLFDKGGLMMDCGGGSYSQLFRKYGAEVTKKKLAKLKFIYLSHLHTDHHQGLFKVVEMRHRALVELDVPKSEWRLCILTPPNGQFYMRDIESTLTLGKDIWSYLEFYDSNDHDNVHNQPMLEFLRRELRLAVVQTIPVVHNFAATGIVLRSELGWSVGYSGDTTFCEQLATHPLCQELTVLIHEATFQDHQHELAKKKSHSTFSDAIRTAKLNHAYMTILTHFSQRYPKIDPVGNTFDHQRVVLSFDFMTVNLANLQSLPQALSKLKVDPNEDEQVEVGF